MKPLIGNLLFNQSVPYYNRMKALFGSALIAYWPLTETSGTVAADVSGNSRNGTYSGVDLANLAFPFGRSIPYFDGTAYVNVYSAGFAGAFNPLEGFVSCWVHLAEDDFLDLQYRKFFRFAVNTNNRVEIQKNGTNTDAIAFAYRAGGTISSIVPTQISTLWGGMFNFILSWSKSNVRVRAYVNGAQSGSDATGLGVWSGSLAATTVNIGAADQASLEPLIGHVGHVAVGNREITPSEALLVYNNLQRKLIAFEGDSRTVGTGATNAAYAYPAKTVRQLVGNYKCSNVGESGQSLVTMLSEINTDLNLSDPGMGRIVVIWGGLNDNTDAETMASRLWAYCDAAHALGYKVVVCTEIDCQAPGHENWHSETYLALNLIIAELWAEHADALADLGDKAALQDATNGTYFNADKTHLTDAGYTEVANVVAAAIGTL